MNIATTKINRKDGAYMFAFENTQNAKSSIHGVLQQSGNLSLFKEVLPSAPIEGLTYAKPSEKGGKRSE